MEKYNVALSITVTKRDQVLDVQDSLICSADPGHSEHHYEYLKIDIVYDNSGIMSNKEGPCPTVFLQSHMASAVAYIQMLKMVFIT